MSIAVVVPTARYETEYPSFLSAWAPLFRNHHVKLITVIDGARQALKIDDYSKSGTPFIPTYWADEVFESSLLRLVDHYSPACRNLGFAYIARELPDVDVVITLDDDVRPFGDTIADHILALHTKVSTDWVNTFNSQVLFPRGFPYGERYKVEVGVSHGVWYGVKDWDAPTQLVLGNPDVSFFQGPVPKGPLMAVCGMNLAFKRKLLPYVYYAPVAQYPGVERFDDIFMGIHLKRWLDNHDLALVTGYAAVLHERASDVFKNLTREAEGIRLLEDYNSHADEDFFMDYMGKRVAWRYWMGTTLAKQTVH